MSWAVLLCPCVVVRPIACKLTYMYVYAHSLTQNPATGGTWPLGATDVVGCFHRGFKVIEIVNRKIILFTQQDATPST